MKKQQNKGFKGRTYESAGICEHCGIETGRGKRHKDDCPNKAKPSKGKDSAMGASGGFRIDGRTSIAKLVKMEAEIRDELDERMKTNKPEVVTMRKRYESLSKLEDQAAEAADKLAEAKADFGL